MNLNLSNKTALVTRANRGTGQIIASTLASEGTRVIVHSNQQPDDPETDDVVFSDLATAEGCKQVLEQLQGRHVDILVNNYGSADRHNWQNSDTDKWQQPNHIMPASYSPPS